MHKQFSLLFYFATIPLTPDSLIPWFARCIAPLYSINFVQHHFFYAIALLLLSPQLIDSIRSQYCRVAKWGKRKKEMEMKELEENYRIFLTIYVDSKATYDAFHLQMVYFRY